MEIKIGIQEKILKYICVYGKENKYRLASALKTDMMEVTKALSNMEKQGVIEMKSGNATLVKGKKPITIKPKKRKKPKVEVKEEQPIEESEEQPKTEVPEETPTKEEVRETFEQKPEEEVEERVEGTVKFYNPNKGFGFITGDDGKEYYVHESRLKEGVAIEAEDRVSFKAAEGDKGPIAKEVEKISQDVA